MASFMQTSDRDKEKSKSTNQSKQLPKDAQVIISILRELGIEDFEQRVINQLLEFTYRYVTCILDDAKVFANHAKKKVIDMDDVKLASVMLLDKSFSGPPPREVLMEGARTKNSQPLPLIKPHSGLRLPPDRHCLLAANYKLRAATSAAPTKKLTKSAIEGRSTIKTQFISANVATTIKKPTVLGQTIKTQSIVTIPKPVFKVQKQMIAKPRIIPNTTSNIIKMETDSTPDTMKRKRSEDFD